MIDRIVLLLKEKSITAKKLTDDLELSNSAITDWKKGKGKPSAYAIVKIANYFNVSADYLLTGKNFSFSADKANENLFSSNLIIKNQDEENLVVGFRSLDNFNKGLIIGKMQTLLEFNKDNFDYSIYAADQNEKYDTITVNAKKGIKHIPILGKTNEEFSSVLIMINDAAYVEVPNFLDVDYAFFIKDDSMFPFIPNNSLVFIKEMSIVENGAVAIVKIDGDLYCRQINNGGSTIQFTPLNKNIKPFILKKKSEEYQFLRQVSIKSSVINSNIESYKIIGKVLFCMDGNSNFFTI